MKQVTKPQSRKRQKELEPLLRIVVLSMATLTLSSSVSLAEVQSNKPVPDCDQLGERSLAFSCLG